MASKVSRRVLARTIAAKLVADPSQRDHWLQALAAYLVEQNRVDEVDLIVNDISHELFTQNGQLLVDVTSARPLGDEAREAIRTALQSQTNAATIELAEQVDPSLLGGFVARTPDAVMDASVRSKLKQLAAIK